MAKFILSFDLDEGWEQALPMECGSLEEAKVAAVENLYDFNPDLDDDFPFTIYEVKETHQCNIEDLAQVWEALWKKAQESRKAYNEQYERQQYEALKRKYGE